MIHRLAARALALVIAALCAAPALAQPQITSLNLLDANNAPQKEATVVFGGNFYQGHMNFGWDWAGNAPVAWRLDAATGAGFVLNSQEHGDLTAVIQALESPPAGGATANLQTSVGATAHTDAGSIASALATSNAALAQIQSNTAPGTAGSGISPPAGGSGLLGFLSGIYKALTGTLSVAVTNYPTNQATTEANSGAIAAAVKLPASFGAVTAGTAFAPGVGIAAVCTGAGNLVLDGSDASQITVPVGVGYSQFGFAIAKVDTASTATCTFTVLR